MAAVVLAKRKAVDRLAELGLDVGLIERVVRRADADVSTFTEFDPPIMQGLTRWGRISRYLREELIPQGWSYDNPRNLARTIHPSGEFAIVAATGDELTGLVGLLPTTRYRKGDATVQAVAINEQLTFDFGDGFTTEMTADAGALLTWILLFFEDEAEFRVELSLPDGIEDGRITSWSERIILPPFPRGQAVMSPLFTVPFEQGTFGDGDQHEHVVVEVTRR